ncbi:unnamed protein product, partial [Phaeothamnion confervicola]
DPPGNNVLELEVRERFASRPRAHSIRLSSMGRVGTPSTPLSTGMTSPHMHADGARRRTLSETISRSGSGGSLATAAKYHADFTEVTASAGLVAAAAMASSLRSASVCSPGAMPPGKSGGAKAMAAAGGAASPVAACGSNGGLVGPAQHRLHRDSGKSAVAAATATSTHPGSRHSSSGNGAAVWGHRGSGSGGSGGGSGDGEREPPEVKDLLTDDSLFDPGAILTKGMATVTQKVLALVTEDELVGTVRLPESRMRQLAERTEPVEVGVRMSGAWRRRGLVRLRISFVRLEAWIVGASGLNLPREPQDLSCRVTWRGRPKASRGSPAWQNCFCLSSRAATLSLDVRPPAAAARRRRVTLTVSRAMHLSTFDPVGLADLLNSTAKSKEVGTAEVHESGFRFTWDRSGKCFVIYNVKKAKFTLLGSESTLATTLLGFSAADHIAAPSPRELADPHAPIEPKRKYMSVQSDELPRPLFEPEWQQVTWGPTLLEVMNGGQLAVEVWSHQTAAAADAAASAAAAAVPHPL